MLRMEYGSKMDACWAAQNQHCGGDTISRVPVSSKIHISCAPLQATFPVLKKKSTKPICASRDALAYTMVQQLGGTICPRLLLQFIVLDWQSGLGDSTCLRILSCSQIVGPAFSKESWQAVELHLMYLLKGFI